jgi:hypothetical protein
MEPRLRNVGSGGSKLVTESETPKWVIVANIKSHERGGIEPEKLYKGTKVFRPRTKVYLGLFFAGMGTSSHVIGLSRNRRRFANCVVNIELLENVRPKLEYSEPKLKTLGDLDCMFFDDERKAQAHADMIAASIEHWIARSRAKSA